MNTIIASAQTAFDLLNSRRVGDTTFYTNSISLIQDYNTILQFSNLGVNSSYLIKDLNIGKDDIIAIFIAEGILPKNFLSLDKDPNQLPRLKHEVKSM
jgi:hypothetical protein